MMNRRAKKYGIIRRWSAFVCSFLLSGAICAQVSLERQVIGSAGGYVSLGSGLSVAATTGEAVVATFDAGTYLFTQGFHQPNSMLLAELTFTDQPFQSICPDVPNGKIEVNELGGCLPPYIVRLRKLEGGQFIVVAEDSVPENEISRGVVFENLGIDTFMVEVVGATYCVKADTFFLDAKNPDNCALKVYSGITPNSDGMNDNWQIDNIEVYGPNEVKIFNRWGSVVWEAKNYNNLDVVWSGENKNGNDLPDATYFYVIKTSVETFDGWIELTR